MDTKKEIQDTVDRAELFEAKARIARAQADITLAQLERKKALLEINTLEPKK